MQTGFIALNLKLDRPPIRDRLLHRGMRHLFRNPILKMLEEDPPRTRLQGKPRRPH